MPDTAYEDQVAREMSVKDAFNDDEWYLLSSTPAMIGAAMSTAAPSGIIGTLKELSAGMRASVEGAEAFPDSPLIAQLLEKSANWEQARERMSDYRARTEKRFEAAGVTTREQLISQVIDDCSRAAALVDERCTATDASAYRQWSVMIARRVAEAAREGSFLGIGGVRVSDEERKMLERLETALGAPTGHLYA